MNEIIDGKKFSQALRYKVKNCVEVIKEKKDNNLHEEKILNLDITKSLKDLNWSPKWDFSESVKKTIQWYKDVYQGDNIATGKKSIAFNVMLEPKDKTLSEKDIDEVSKKIISIVQETTGATLRS